MAYWVFEETTASKSLFLQWFLAAAAFFLCPHPLPAGLFLAIMIYVSLLHSIFNCGTLPCLVPVAQFLPSSVITGVLASHPALHLTGTHHFQILQSVGHKQPFMACSWSWTRIIPCSCSHLHLCTPAWSWYLSTIPLGTVLQIPSLSPSLCAIVVVLRLFGWASLQGHAWGLLEWCGAPIQPVHSNTLEQQGMGKKGACSGCAPAWSLDLPEAHIQAQMLGNSAGFISVGIALDKGCYCTSLLCSKTRDTDDY